MVWERTKSKKNDRKWNLPWKNLMNLETIKKKILTLPKLSWNIAGTKKDSVLLPRFNKPFRKNLGIYFMELGILLLIVLASKMIFIFRT